jgi:hypothetical protein
MRNVECGRLIPNLLPGTAGCETAIEIFYIPHSAFRIRFSPFLVIM